MGAVLGQVGGNIGALDLRRRGTNGNTIFTFRLVVENLNKELEKKLSLEFKDRCKIESVLIV